jgi:pimeloyl-ACP methyl ester carboxylesterase
MVKGRETSARNYLLVPGAGGSGWYWHRVIDELTSRGHRAVAVDLPGADPDAGLAEYRDLIVDDGRDFDRPVTLVAQSLGGFSAPLACDHLPVERLILVNAMIPRPGETAGAWWGNVGWQTAAQVAADRDRRPAPDVTGLDTLFFHDLPDDLVAVMRADPDAAVEGPSVFAQPWPLEGWPAVPTTVIASRNDRLFPLALQRRIARDRLKLAVQTLPGGHLVALSHPAAVADQIAAGSTPDAAAA